MRRLLPSPDDTPDLLDELGRSDRPADSGRPWLMANMIMSIDGAYSVDGRSGGLGGPADHQMFHTLRAACDAVLVGAGTARTESYGRPVVSDGELIDERRRRGLQPAPQLYLMSRSLQLPSDLRLRQGEGPTPVVLHGASSDTEGVGRTGLELRSVLADEAGEIDLRAALRSILDDGHRLVLCEGGPALLGLLHRADLIDELYVTVAPMLVGGPHTGLLGPDAAHVTTRTLHRLYEADGALLANYRRT